MTEVRHSLIYEITKEVIPTYPIGIEEIKWPKSNFVQNTWFRTKEGKPRGVFSLHFTPLLSSTWPWPLVGRRSPCSWGPEHAAITLPLPGPRGCKEQVNMWFSPTSSEWLKRAGRGLLPRLHCRKHWHSDAAPWIPWSVCLALCGLIITLTESIYTYLHALLGWGL